MGEVIEMTGPGPGDAEVNGVVMTITPEMAQELLSTTNFYNRPVTPSRVDSYAKAMSNGKWRLNGEPIIYDRTGKLANGQHRLRACAKSGHPFTTYVIRGIDPESWTTLDTGRPRQASDILGALGVKNFHRTSAAIQWIIRIQSGKVSTKGFWQRSRAGHEEVKDFCVSNQAVYESVTAVRKCTFIASGGLLAALHFLFAEKDKIKAGVFFEDLAKGEGLYEEDPLFQVREKLMKAKGTSKIPQFEVAALLIVAWNLRRQGLKGARVKGVVNDSFPKII